MAWVYISAFTQPGCNQAPLPIQALPAPQERLLSTEDGLRLRAWYYPPENGAVVISLGGLGGSLGAELPPVEFLILQGYGVLQIDSRACAQPPSRVTLGAKETLSAKAGLDFLGEQAEVQHVGAIGFSMGGATAIRAAARYPEIEAVAAEGGFFNLGKDMVEPGQPKPLIQSGLLYTIAGFYWMQTGVNPWQVSPVDDLPFISPRPVLLIYGEYEADAGRALVQYKAAREPKELWIVPGGDHGRNHLVAPEEYERRLSDFFNRALLNP
jgi:pimeloyl-ACP methyl ester carboxylesterase